jgi:hypothetical protein
MMGRIGWTIVNTTMKFQIPRKERNFWIAEPLLDFAGFRCIEIE